MRVARRAGRLVIVVLILLLPIVAGAVGYYLGRQDQQRVSAAASFPVWTDQEVHFNAGTILGTLRCTYHRADGTTRITETVITLTPAAASGRICPPSP